MLKLTLVSFVLTPGGLAQAKRCTTAFTSLENASGPSSSGGELARFKQRFPTLNPKSISPGLSRDEFAFEGTTYRVFETVPIADTANLKKPLEAVALSHFRDRFLGTKGLRLSDRLDLFLNPDGTKLIAATPSPTIKWSPRVNRAEESRIERYRAFAWLLQLAFGLPNTSRPLVDRVGDRYLVSSGQTSSSLTELAKPLEPSDYRKLISAIRADGVALSSQTLQFFLDGLSELDRVEAALLKEWPELDEKLMQLVRSRIKGLVSFLREELRFQKGSAEDFSALIAQQKSGGGESFDQAAIEQLRALLRKRLDQDIRAHTRFKSLEHYKNTVLAIPEYRMFAEKFSERVFLQIHRSPSARLGIITKGFQSLHTTSRSSIRDGSEFEEYRRERIQVEARALGVSEDRYLELVSPSLRPKSAFALYEDQIRFEGSQYGNDSYVIPLSGVLKQPNAPLVTLSLGDSKDFSHIWYARVMPLEDFAIVAAPFLVDAERLSRTTGLSVANYRGVDQLGQFPPVLPKFLGDLGSMVQPYIRTDQEIEGGFEPIDTPLLYVEAQIFGGIGLSHVKAFSHSAHEPIPVGLKQAFQRTGIKVHSYR